MAQKIIFIALLLGCIGYLALGAPGAAALISQTTAALNHGVSALDSGLARVASFASRFLPADIKARLPLPGSSKPLSGAAWGTATTSVSNISGKLKDSLSVAKREVITPAPLTKESSASSQSVPANDGALTRSGVIQLTNNERLRVGVTSLAESQTLDGVALTKARDILAKQYFAHISPTGVGVADLVTAAGYSYLIVGENLALGDFQSDAELVEAWMNSPGHRENIMNPKFREIGVAVVQGVYENKIAWVGVQTFGTSLAVCPQADNALKLKIEDDEALLKIYEDQGTAIKAQIEAMPEKSGADYNAKVEAYNALVPQINGLIDQIKSEINRYNAQIKALNACIEGSK